MAQPSEQELNGLWKVEVAAGWVMQLTLPKAERKLPTVRGRSYLQVGDLWTE